MKKIRKVINKDIYNKNIIMDNFKRNIDKLVSRILNEEIENKAKTIAEQMEFGEWKEIDANEELKGKQKNIDVAEPKGKITSADFKKLRDAKKHKKEVDEYYHSDIKDLGDFEDDKDDMRKRYKMMDEPSSDDGDYSGMRNVMRKRYNKDMGISDDEDFAKSNKEEMDEFYFYDDEEDESTPGDYEGDEDEEEEAEELSAQEPTYVGKGLSDNKPGKMFGSFDDEHGWFDDSDRAFKGNFDFDYDEEEFEDFPSMYDKIGKNQKWFAPGKEGQRYFDTYKEKFGSPFKVRTRRGDMEEQETEEGNEFTEKLMMARKDGDKTMKVGGKTLPVKESEEKWIQKTNIKKGALHKKLGIREGDKIPKSKLNSLKKELMAKAKGDKKLSAADSTLLKQVTLALTLKSVKESTNSLRLTEDELIDMIENIVIEQKVKDVAEKNNISKKEPSGLKKTEKSWKTTEKFGKEYMTDLVKKMKDYLKDSSKGSFEMNPEDFPQSNYDMEKEHNEMKYHPSDAVEEYIEAFAYPGMTNLVYDEIKPDDKRIEKQLKGDATTGNAVTSKDGKALGNVSKRSGEVGERFKKNYDENLYGAEQQKASYKRQPQETIEVEGNGKSKGSLKSKQGADKSSSINKATKILNTLESTEDKKTKVISEEMNKMKNLISYNRKTQ